MQHEMKQIIRKSLAGFIAVWLSGFVFLFCCHASLAASHVKDSCPMGKQAHHCDLPMEQADDATPADSIDGVCVTGCGYLPAVFDKARKVDQPAPVTAPERVAVTPRLITPRPARAPLVTVYRARLADKSRTFISNQVFRI